MLTHGPRSSANQTASDSTGKDAKWDTVVDSGMSDISSPLPPTPPIWGRSTPPQITWTAVLLTSSVLGLVVDEFASKEGVPAAADPEINNLINDEVNKL